MTQELDSKAIPEGFGENKGMVELVRMMREMRYEVQMAPYRNLLQETRAIFKIIEWLHDRYHLISSTYLRRLVQVKGEGGERQMLVSEEVPLWDKRKLEDPAFSLAELAAPNSFWDLDLGTWIDNLTFEDPLTPKKIGEIGDREITGLGVGFNWLEQVAGGAIEVSCQLIARKPCQGEVEEPVGIILDFIPPVSADTEIIY